MEYVRFRFLALLRAISKYQKFPNIILYGSSGGVNTIMYFHIYIYMCIIFKSIRYNSYKICYSQLLALITGKSTEFSPLIDYLVV